MSLPGVGNKPTVRVNDDGIPDNATFSEASDRPDSDGDNCILGLCGWQKYVVPTVVGLGGLGLMSRFDVLRSADEGATGGGGGTRAVSGRLEVLTSESSSIDQLLALMRTRVSGGARAMDNISDHPLINIPGFRKMLSRIDPEIKLGSTTDANNVKALDQIFHNIAVLIGPRREDAGFIANPKHSLESRLDRLSDAELEIVGHAMGELVVRAEGLDLETSASSQFDRIVKIREMVAQKILSKQPTQ